MERGGRGKEVRIKDKVGIERRETCFFQNAIEGGLSSFCSNRYEKKKIIPGKILKMLR